MVLEWQYWLFFVMCLNWLFSVWFNHMDLSHIFLWPLACTLCTKGASLYQSSEPELV